MSELNLFATFPISNTYNLPIGDNQFDFITGEVIAADDTVLPMAKRTNRDKPLKFLWIDCETDVNVTIHYLGEIQYTGRLPSDGFAFEDLTYDQLVITTTSVTRTHVIGSSSPITGIGGAGAGGSGDHDVTGIDDGRKVVAVAGVAEPLAADTPAKYAIVTAETNNTDIVVVGGSTVVAALLTRQGNPLFPGDTNVIPCKNLADIYVDVLVGTEGVTFSYLT